MKPKPLKKLYPFRANIISSGFGILFVLYFIIISRKWGRLDGFNAVMIVFGFLWILISIKIHTFIGLVKKLPKAIKITGQVLLVSFAVSFIVIEGLIIYHTRTMPAEEADYVIILGCQVVGIYASVPLIQRTFTAVNYLRKNPNTRVVITGGQGPGEDISEAEAMKRLLLERGIDRNRILEETKAANTMENFILSNKLRNLTDKNIVVVTSDFHMYRALSIAKKLNYKNVTGLPSRSQLSALPVYLLREYAAVVYYNLLKRI